MSDADRTVTGYPPAEMPAPPEKQLRGGAQGTGADVFATGTEATRSSAIRLLSRKHGIAYVPHYEALSVEALSRALTDVRRHAVRRQIVGSLVAIVISLVLFIVSANGAVIALATFVSGMTASHIVARYGDRRVSRRSELWEQQLRGLPGASDESGSATRKRMSAVA